MKDAPLSCLYFFFFCVFLCVALFVDRESAVFPIHIDVFLIYVRFFIFYFLFSILFIYYEMDGLKLAFSPAYDVKKLREEFHSFSPRDGYIELCHQQSVKPNTTVSKSFPAEIGRWDDVTRIDLSRTYVGPKGFEVILQMCKRLPNLTFLGAGDNHLTNDSVYSLASMGLYHPSLAEIDLRGNRFISWSGAMWLIELAQKNNALTSIQVAYTSIDLARQETLFEQTRINAAIQFSAHGSKMNPPDHPSVLHLRAMKRFFVDLQDESETIPITAIADGFHEYLRIIGRQQEIGNYTETYFQALMSRVTPGSTRIDWNAFVVLLFCPGAAYNIQLCELLRRVFLSFNVEETTRRLPMSSFGSISGAGTAGIHGPKEPVVQAKDLLLIYQRLQLLYAHGGEVGGRRQRSFTRRSSIGGGGLEATGGPAGSIMIQPFKISPRDAGRRGSLFDYSLGGSSTGMMAGTLGGISSQSSSPSRHIPTSGGTLTFTSAALSSPTEAEMASLYSRLGIKREATLTWDEFLLVFYPRGPEEGVKLVGIFETSLAIPDALRHLSL